MICSLSMFGCSIYLAILVGFKAYDFKQECSSPSGNDGSYHESSPCSEGLRAFLATTFGSFGGFNTSALLADFPDNKLGSEVAAFAISNGTQLLFSALYLLLIYNITLISIEHDWGKLEKQRERLRCTIVRGTAFNQSYLLQLPKKVLFPIMTFSAIMHWLLGQAISTRETIVSDPVNQWETSLYAVSVHSTV